jgi:histidine ammonia-lyase
MHTIKVDGPIVIDGHTLTIQDVITVARAAPGEVALTFSPDAVAAVERASQAVDQIVSENQVVYGITTGFGAFKDKIIP